MPVSRRQPRRQHKRNTEKQRRIRLKAKEESKSPVGHIPETERDAMGGDA